MTALRAKGVFEPGTLDFGEVPVDMPKTLPVTLRNTGEINFKLVSVTVPQGFSVRGMKEVLEGHEILPGTQLDLEVVFLPTSAGPRQEVLVVSDGDREVQLELKGAGVIRQVPVLAVTPVGVDFGAVALGDTSRAAVQISNTGTADGVIEQASLRSTSSPVGPTDVFAIGTQLPVVVPVGGSVTLDLVFRPTVEAQVSDVMVLDAADHQPLEIGLTGLGIVPLGDILCTPSRVDFGSVERGMTATLPVTCEARGGPARIIGARINDNPMFVVPSPPNTSDLTSGQSLTIDVEFRPDGTPSAQNGTLNVEYNGGMGTSVATVNLVGQVIPPPATETAVTLRLEWSSNGTDVDLHFVGPGGVFFESPGDCHFANATPDWGAAGNTSDNPFLDADDIDGYGPEEINLTVAASGTYDVYVHYWDDHNTGNTDATVQIHLDGQLQATRVRSALRCGQVWHVGSIQWSGSNGTFVPVDRMDLARVENCLF